MGLDTTHNCWHASYTTFARWRNEVASAVGWGLREDATVTTSYAIPDGRVPNQDPLPDETITEDGETYTIKWSESYDNSVWLGHWDKDPEDVIDVLMVHSDCEGIIPHRFTEPLAERLHGLLPLIHEDWRDLTMQFVTGLLLANTRGEDVEFH